MIFESLAKPIRDAIEDFQRYVVSEYRRGVSKWPHAQGLVQAIAREFGKDLKPGKSPIDPHAVAQRLSVEISYKLATQNSVCGRIVPTEKGFKALVSGAPGEPRARFSIAHECGHVFFYYPSPKRPERIIPNSFDADSRFARREEGLCDDFARVLLLPEESIADLMSAEANLVRLLSTAQKQSVAPETLVRRLLYDLERWDSSVLYCMRWTDSLLQIQTYRGLHRRKKSDRAPSAKLMTEVLRDRREEWSLEGLRTRFQADFAVSDPEIRFHGSAVWVSM